MKDLTKVLQLKSCQSEISKLSDFLEEVSQSFPLAPGMYPDILISLTEAVNNAIIHGNSLNMEKCVDIHCHCQNEQLVFCISDEGQGFDMEEVADPTIAVNLEKEGGRGVLIMKSLCNSLEYKDNGSTIQLAFDLNGQ